MKTSELKKGSDCFHCRALFHCISRTRGRGGLVPPAVCDALWAEFLAKVKEKEATK